MTFCPHHPYPVARQRFRRRPAPSRPRRARPTASRAGCSGGPTNLCAALRWRVAWCPQWLFFAESFGPETPAQYAQTAIKIIVLADALFADISGLESPAQMGYVVELPAPPALLPMRPRWCSTGCRTRAMWGRFCAARRLLALAKCWRSKARRRCGRPRCCARAWARTLACA